MTDMIAGPGQGLPRPQALYPPQLWTTPYTAPTNRVDLCGGQSITIPAGTWIVTGMGCVASCVQWLDPVSCQWLSITEIGGPFGVTVRSDGFNYRVYNSSGTALTGSVTAPGTGYQPNTISNPNATLVTPSAGNSSWTAVVGGALGAVTITSPGANYTIPPLVFVPAPPPCGVAAVGFALISGAGAVTSITWTNAGAGYLYPPPIVIVPTPADPALETIQNATATTVLTGAGTVTAVLLKCFGAPQATAPTLTVTGAGSGATAATAPATLVAPVEETITIQPSSGP
jgi:hypothetical protein